MTDQATIDRVATEIMGWESSDSGRLWHKDGLIWCHRMDGRGMDWNPVRNIAHAFDVVEAMRGRGWEFKLDDDAANESSPWICAFEPGHGHALYTNIDWPTFMGTGPTPAEAITRAALATLENNQGGA